MDYKHFLSFKKNIIRGIIMSIITVSLFSCVSNTEPTDDKLPEKEDTNIIHSKVEMDKELCEEGDFTIMKKSYQKGKAKYIEADITVDFGKFTIKAGHDEAINARIKYLNELLHPVINYKEQEDKGLLAVYISRFSPNEDNEYSSEDKTYCDLQLSNNIPMDLNVHFGAGKGEFNLEGIQVKNLDIESGAGQFDIILSNTPVENILMKAGAGEANIDLTGEWDHDVTADFTCGVGQITVKLPKTVNIKIHTTGLLGSIKAHGFKKDHRDYYFSPKTDTDIDFTIEITGAIGEIILDLEN